MNRNGWEKRLLVVYLQSIGDAVVVTSVLKHYRNAFSGKRIYLLVKHGLGVETIVSPFVDEILTIDYRAFATNPFYGFKLINFLRSIGFKNVIDQDHSPAEIMGQIVTLSLIADETVAYEGIGILFQNFYDQNMRASVGFAVKKLHPKFTRLIPSLDKHVFLPSLFKSVVEHYIYFFDELTKQSILKHPVHNYATELIFNHEDEYSFEEIFRKCGILPNQYVIINLGSNATWRNWPVTRFIEVASVYIEKNIPVILIGVSHQKYLAKEFKRGYRGMVVDLVGTTTLSESFVLIHNCLMVLTNDTSTVHVAVAEKKPSVCIVGGGYANAMAFYGYRDINMWVWEPSVACMADNWRCANHLSVDEVAPCVAAVTVKEVARTVRALLDYLVIAHEYPREPFCASFTSP